MASNTNNPGTPAAAAAAAPAVTGERTGRRLPRYLRISPQRAGLEAEDSEEEEYIESPNEEEEEEDAGLSDVEQEEANLLTEAAVEAQRLRRDEPDDGAADGAEDADLGITETSTTPVLKIPEPPEGWEATCKRDEEHGEPPFHLVDNPGGWHEYTYRPVFSGTKSAGNKKYEYHQLATGCRPVPADADGKRSVGGWDAYYDDDFAQYLYKKPDGMEDLHGPFREGAHKDDLFPERRQGKLDAEKLRSYGLTREIMEDEVVAPAFFFNLILPFFDTENRSNWGQPDGRKSFYHPVAQWSNIYAASEGLLGNGYTHHMDAIYVPDLLKFHGAIIKDGALGGSDGDIGCRWRSDSEQRDEKIHKALPYHVSFTGFSPALLGVSLFSMLSSFLGSSLVLGVSLFSMLSSFRGPSLHHERPGSFPSSATSTFRGKTLTRVSPAFQCHRLSGE
jgi:hypothetical protein